MVTGEVNGAYQVAHGTIGAGAEYRREAINSNSLGKRNRDNLGAFGEYRHQFGSRLTATAGLYLNSNTDFGTQLLPGLEAGYSLSRHWRVTGSMGSGQRQPTYTDLYYKGPANIGNDSLQPERAIYAEASLQYHHPLFQAQGSYAYRRIAHFIDWVRSADTDPWQPQNYARINTQVFSIRMSYELSQHLKLPAAYAVRLNASFTHLNPSLQSTEGIKTKYAIDALRNQGLASLNALLYSHLQLALTARYQQRFNAVDYWVMDARVGYQLKDFLFYVDGNNLLNASYYESGAVPLPGRWLAFGARFSR